MGNHHFDLNARQRMAVLIDRLAIEVNILIECFYVFRRPFLRLFEFLRIRLLQNLSGTRISRLGRLRNLSNGRWINGRGNF